MKHITSSILVMSILLFTISACQQHGDGPRSWIDQPLDNDNFPLQKITLQAHASDADGVKDIEFLVDDQSIIVINAGGERIGKALFEWMPPAPGIYTIYAQAFDNKGTPGDAASAQITVGDQVAQVLPEEPEQPELNQDEEEEEDPIQAAQEPAEGPFAVPSQDINCRSGPSTEFEVLTVLPSAKQAKIVGRLENNTWLLISHPENFIECWIAANIVDIVGAIGTVRVAQAPELPEEPPEEQPPEEPPPEEEEEHPPMILSVSVSPETFYQEFCYGETQTTTLRVEVMDIGGTGVRVEAAWAIGNEIGSTELEEIGYPRFETIIGPFNNTGTLSIYGSAIDGDGLWTPFSITAEVEGCLD